MGRKTQQVQLAIVSALTFLLKFKFFRKKVQTSFEKEPLLKQYWDDNFAEDDDSFTIAKEEEELIQL